jgi:predicted secreted protein
MPVTNALKRLMQKTRSLSYCIALVMVVLFVYGLIRYPDLPIRECPSGYCGRQGQPHTAAEYNAFKIWQTTLFIVWPIGMLIMLLLQRGKPKR